MKRNDFWKFILVIFIVLWSLYEMYPPTNQDLIKTFETRAVKRDATFNKILARLKPLEKAQPNLEFRNLREAIGTNDIQSYFAFINAKDKVDPTIYILNQLQRDASGKIKLGLDLQGGTSYLVSMDVSKLAVTETKTNSTGQVVTVTNIPDVSGALAQGIEVLRKRIDRFGVAEPVLQPVGTHSIRVELPGLSPADRASAMEQITNSAYLEFRMVARNSSTLVDQNTGKVLSPIPPGYEEMKLVEQLGKDKFSTEYLVVKKKPEDGLAGDIIKNAQMGRGNLGEPEIDFRLNDKAAKEFGDVTRNNIGRRMAIVLDGQLYSAPTIQSAIEQGSGQITGQFTAAQAQQLANVLENPLRAPLTIESSSDVDPTLGKDSIQSGIRASILGVILVAGFMLVYYLLSGLIANVALILNVIILLGVMCSLGATFTLPGIAGVVLTIGMAVDANVLIYERIREEQAKGKSIRGAVTAGYERAFGTIFDSNITTLIASVILIFMGSGDVKGFGVTLTIGVTASLFTALVVTRLIFNWLLDHNWINSLYMFHLIRSTKLDFMKLAKPAFILSWTIILVGLSYGIFARGTQLLSVDFLGGDSTTYSFQQKVGVEQIRSALRATGQKDSQIQYQTDASGRNPTLRVTTTFGSAKKVEQTLEQKFPAAHFKPIGEEHVGPIIGHQMLERAVVSCLLALFGILVYVAFRYEFSFAVGAVLAVIHDVLMTIGCYCLSNGFSGREFNSTVVAAILTIIGFSINDTIVIFDRIREDLKLGLRGSFREVINQALNQTLSRTIITSGTVFLATLALYIFGGGVINDFAFTFLVGILTGTYSSIYIASALVLWWHKGERPAIGKSQITMQGVPAAKA